MVNQSAQIELNYKYIEFIKINRKIEKGKQSTWDTQKANKLMYLKLIRSILILKASSLNNTRISISLTHFISVWMEKKKQSNYMLLTKTL